ncbi:hypothetical protein [Singulisphaera sp. PoT]|uniref:hypothetical protein n=1 Tax=Singulisphaera sp. PoT TaxID=3411797 RepID=UPI003BF57DAC
MSRVRLNAFPLLAAVVLATASGPALGQETKASPGNSKIKQVTAPKGGKVKPLEDAECLELASKISEAIGAKDFEDFNRVFDFNAMLEAMSDGIPTTDEFREDFHKRSLKSLQGDQGIFERIAEQVSRGGSYTFLRLHSRDQRKTALFRMILPEESGVNYHEYYLARKPDGGVHATDLYVYLSGETMSQTLRRFYLPVAASVPQNPFSKFSGPEKDLVKSFDTVKKMTHGINERKFQDTLDAYFELPPSLRKDKYMLLLRIQAAQGANDDKVYHESLQTFRIMHPKDPCVDIFSIDYFLLNKEFDKCMTCIDRVDKELGGDPYLDVLRVGLHRTENKLDVAWQDVTRAMKREPTLFQAYEAQLDLSLALKKYDSTLSSLKILREQFGIVFKDLSTVPEYAGFVASPEYKAWEAYAKAKKGEGKLDEPTKEKAGDK